jgi:hypothetical protein
MGRGFGGGYSILVFTNLLNGYKFSVMDIFATDGFSQKESGDKGDTTAHLFLPCCLQAGRPI